MSTTSTLIPESPETPMDPTHPTTSTLSPTLSADERRPLRQAVGLLNLDQSRFILAVIAETAGMASAVSLSEVAAWFITRTSQIPDIVALGVALVAVRLFGISCSVLRYCERLVSHDTALRGMGAPRTCLYESPASVRTDTVAGLRRDDVLTRMDSDIDAVRDPVVRAYLPATIAAVLGTATCLGVGVVYWPTGLVLLACLLLSRLMGPLATIRSARIAEQAYQRQATELSTEVLTILEEIPELSVPERLTGSVHQIVSREGNLTRLQDRAAVPATIAAAMDIAAMGLTVLGNLVVGVSAVSSGQLAPVWLVVIVLVPLVAFETASALGPASMQLVGSAGAACHVAELVEAVEIGTASGSMTSSAPLELPEPSAQGPYLKARGLAVGWPNGLVVAEGIDLDLRVGRRVAIVEPSGISKSALPAMLARLLEPRGDTLTLDGVPPQQAVHSEMAARVCLTAKDVHVFHTSVLEDLHVARGSVTPVGADELLRRAGLGRWLEALPEGVETIVGTDTTTLSGGERRRLLLARALAVPAPLMLLNEPSEHLDALTADRFMTNLLTAGDQGHGTLLVTHRLSTLKHTDEVLAMGHRPQTTGEQAPAAILHQGSHRELQDASETYRWSLSQENRGRQQDHVSGTS